MSRKSPHVLSPRFSGPEPSPPGGQVVPERSVPNQTPSQQHPDMAVKLTRGTSCVLCQQRKVRCDKSKPCANCLKARVECRVVPPQPPRRRKKRLQEKDLIERLRKYEALLSENNIDFESITAELPGGVSGVEGARDEVTGLGDDFEGLRTSSGSSTTPSARSREMSQSEKPYKWFPYHKDFRVSEELFCDSSDEDDVDGSVIHHVFDQMYEHQDGFPFIIGARCTPVTHLHPSPIHIFQLWQAYINNINPLLRITHVPTTQGRVIESSARLEGVSSGLEAFMFAVYLIALISFEDAEVRAMFGEPKMQVVRTFHLAAQQALINAGFMRTSDITVLQAYILYLTAARQFMDPRQIFCLLAIAVRAGQRMGLHRDPAPFGHSPFDVEQRRRLWWTIVAYDGRIGEMTGSTVTAVSSGSDTRMPLNINDTDLHVDAREAPAPRVGPTEMLFCLTRLELSLVVRSESQRDAPIGGGDATGTPAPAVPTIPTVRVAGKESISYTLDGFCAHIEDQYLRHCDVKIPLHFFTLTMTRQALCKMRILGFLVRLNQENLTLPGDSPMAPEPPPLNNAEREALFCDAIQMIEYDNVLQSAETLRGYRWYTYMHFPVPAYMFLVTELRRRTTGPVVERAWVAVDENYGLRGGMNNLHRPMHAAFGELLVKAWDARVAGLREEGRRPTEPGWITGLRARVRRRKADGGSSVDGERSANGYGVEGRPGTGGQNSEGGRKTERDYVDMDWSYIT